MEEIPGQPVDVGSLFHDLQGFVHPRWWTINSMTTPPQQKKTGGHRIFPSNKFPIKSDVWDEILAIERETSWWNPPCGFFLLHIVFGEFFEDLKL